MCSNDFFDPDGSHDSSDALCSQAITPFFYTEISTTFSLRVTADYTLSPLYKAIVPALLPYFYRDRSTVSSVPSGSLSVTVLFNALSHEIWCHDGGSSISSSLSPLSGAGLSQSGGLPPSGQGA